MTLYKNTLAAFVFALSLAACDSGREWNNLEFYNVAKRAVMSEKSSDRDSMGVDDDFAQLKDDDMREMDVTVDMAFVKSSNTTNDSICRLINGQIIENLLGQPSHLSTSKAIERFIEEEKKEFRSDDYSPIYTNHVKGHAEYGKDNVINYWFSEEVFNGGAHPSTTTTILCFNATTGQLIDYNNVFTLANNRKLRDALLHKLMADNNVATVEELNKKGYLEMMDMFVSKNFALEADSIVFYYNEYDIAPYAFGPSSISLAYSDLEGIINEEYSK